MSDRLAAYRSLSLAERRTLLALGGLVLAGLALRTAFMLAYRPGFLGYPDTGAYFTGAGGDLFWDPLRVAGYSVFLRLGHALSSDLSFVTLVQHGLGIATALLLYGTVRRIGGPPWLGLVPAAVVLLGGDQLFFEHALLSESLYTFLTAAGIYTACRYLEGGWLAWALAAGALLALASTVRLAGLAVLVVGLAWLLLAVPVQPFSARLLKTAGAAIAGALVLFAYLAAAHDQTGSWSFAPNGGYNFYGRAATFADCSRFDPPSRTKVLCETRPSSQRPSPQWYIFFGPAVSHFGDPNDAPPKANVDAVTAFGREAALHQPLDWLVATARDFARYVTPDSHKGSDLPSTGDYAGSVLTDPDGIKNNLPKAAGYWNTRGLSVRKGLLGALRDYESATRIEGIPLALLLVLALLAPLACSGRERRAALLLAGTGLALLVVPVATVVYDGRFAVPAFGFVAGAAALGAWGLAGTIRRRRGGRLVGD